MVYDVSDIAAFKANGPVLVMVSDPNTQLAMIVPPNSGAESSVELDGDHERVAGVEHTSRASSRAR